MNSTTLNNSNTINSNAINTNTINTNAINTNAINNTMEMELEQYLQNIKSTQTNQIPMMTSLL